MHNGPCPELHVKLHTVNKSERLAHNLLCSLKSDVNENKDIPGTENDG